MAARSGAGQAGSDKEAPAIFALLECFDYAYYATLDVRFYASLPLLKFWPDIDKQVLREFADTVPKEWPEKGLWVWKTQQTGEPVLHKRKKKGAVPHDLGVPEGDPFVAVNQPGWQDTNDWKDLNSKFVLMVYRDYVFTGRKDTAFLRETWPAVKEAIEYLRQFDHGGGVPENSGYPDQTYDSWVVRGRERLLRRLVAGGPARGRRDGAHAGRHEPRQTRITQLFHKAQQDLHQQALEWRIFPLRHGERKPGCYPGRPACRPVVRQHARSGRPGAARNAGLRG